MQRDPWRGQLAAGLADPILRSWLTEPGSLTARCQRACRNFSVRLIGFGRGAPLAEPVESRPLAWVREVVLECDNVPVIFAHTTLAADVRGRMTRWMAGLGNRSLGSLLFAYPGFQRGAIEYLRIDQRHPLYQRAAAHCSTSGPLWARRSRHTLEGQVVSVTEVFLPAIRKLP